MTRNSLLGRRCAFVLLTAALATGSTAIGAAGEGAASAKIHRSVHQRLTAEKGPATVCRFAQRRFADLVSSPQI